jgi:lysine N6-hydroxylase
MLKNSQTKSADVLGVGIGPFNLSLAALLTPITSIKSCFFDQNKTFTWHAGMLLPGAEMQVNYLKDLVTLVDPTNPYSFLSYLSRHKRLYRFMNAQFKNVLRLEFNHYLNWVSRSIPNLFFNETVEDIHFENASFTVHTSQKTLKSQHLVLGNGLTANTPDCAQKYLGSKVFHNSEFLTLDRHKWQRKRIAVIGGGQSGAEIVHYLISQTTELPSQLIWVTRRSQFSPLDDAAFTNDLFTPAYNEYFYQLSENKKKGLLQEQKLASDGISLTLLNTIYQKLYHLEFLEAKGRFFKLIVNHQLQQIDAQADYYNLTIEELDSAHRHIIPADIIILCTGYKWEFPSYLSSLSDKISLKNNRFSVNQDFSIEWDGPKSNRIYVQNAAKHAHGLADPNFCLMAWRSAKIINSINEIPIYDLNYGECTMDLYPSDFIQNEEWNHVAHS